MAACASADTCSVRGMLIPSAPTEEALVLLGRRRSLEGETRQDDAGEEEDEGLPATAICQWVLCHPALPQRTRAE
jgi:hypothetical protein